MEPVLIRNFFTDIENSYYQDVERYLNMGIDPNIWIRNTDGLKALHIACMNDDLNMIRLLLSHGAAESIGYKSLTSQRTPFFYCQSTEAHRLLVETGVSIDINEIDGFGFSKLHNAAIEGNLSYAKYLLDNGANITAKTNVNNTPLHSAVIFGHYEVTELLTSYGRILMTSIQ
jgi:ankyrin repeat protein